MVDAHTHCPCNGALLCRTCHEWAHKHPFEARGSGFIVSRYVTEPGSHPVETFFGAVLLGCDGRYDYNIHTVNGK